jgi:hypothetical protein
MNKVDYVVEPPKPKEYWEAVLAEAQANRDAMFAELGIDDEQIS